MLGKSRSRDRGACTTMTCRMDSARFHFPTRWHESIRMRKRSPAGSSCFRRENFLATRVRERCGGTICMTRRFHSHSGRPLSELN